MVNLTDTEIYSIIKDKSKKNGLYNSQREEMSMNWGQKIIKHFEEQGIINYFGCNGGGVIQLLKHLATYQNNKKTANFYYMSEYTAGFMPIGYYLATGNIACCVCTTGAAQKLAGSGMSDARFMNIPAIYLAALAQEENSMHYPIQDTSTQGMNIVTQLKSEFKNRVFHMNNHSNPGHILTKMQTILSKKQPVFLFFDPNTLCKPVPQKYSRIEIIKRRTRPTLINKLIKELATPNSSRKVLVFCGLEASAEKVSSQLFRDFIKKIDAQVIYSVNGDNIATHTKKENLGHLLLGGNKAAIDAWQQIKKTDIIITLGLDVGEYVLNLQNIPQAICFCLTDQTIGYGQKRSSYQHLFQGSYHQINGPIKKTIETFMQKTLSLSFPKNTKFNNPHDTLPNKKYIKKETVSTIEFYKKIDQLWRPKSLAFEDICIAYRDRQSILKQPNENIKIFSANHGSAMGSAFGLGVGAAISDPKQKIFIFSGDGCFRLYGANLSEACKLNITLFIMDNNNLSIIKNGCSEILKQSKQKNDHAEIGNVDWEKAATAYGWRFFSLHPDLENLGEIMQSSYDQEKTSILVKVPLDTNQVIGKNFRYSTITPSSNL